MAKTERVVPAPPERIFAVLADPSSYAYWVVGSDVIRDADPDWPAIGSRFYHRVGWGPLKINDNTEVLEVDAPRRLVLRARARPLGTARVALELAPEGDGTRVTMIEGPADMLTRLLFNPLTEPLVHRRNAVALRRLEELAVRAA